jgi:hypothetical protein
MINKHCITVALAAGGSVLAAHPSTLSKNGFPEH